MSNKGLSKSKYCKGVQCEKILWLIEFLKKENSTEKINPIFETGKKVGELAKGLFGDYEDVPSDESNNYRIKMTAKLLKDKPNVITEASFSYDNNFCSVDILKNDSDGVEIYEVKSTTKLKNIDMNDPAFQYFILTSLGLNVKKVCVVYLNNKYIRGKELDISQLFHIDDVTAEALERQDEIRNKIDFLNNFMQTQDKDNEPLKEIGKHCFNPRSCEFWDYCTRNLPKPNIFDLNGKYTKSGTKFKKYGENKISFKDLEHEKLSEKSMEQIDFELHDRQPKILKDEIKEFLSTLKYPLYFIDYEAFNCAIPKYEGTFSYQQIPFQYSLHIIQNEGAPLEHKEFLAEINDKNIVRTFAERMINDLPEDGSVIVYNKSFEESQVNKKLAEMYPDLKDEIERINSNIVDFEVPFKNRWYYVKEMRGYSTIKTVLPALYPNDPKLDYSNLSLVHNGSEAPQAFLSLKDKIPVEQKEIRDALLKYCELDTYAMVKIWEKLKEVTNED